MENLDQTIWLPSLDGSNVTLNQLGTTLHVPDNTTAEEFDDFFAAVVKNDKLPIDGVEIKFSDTFWDFSVFNVLNKQKSNYKYDFARCQEVFRVDLKKYILFQYIQDRKGSAAIKKDFENITKFLDFVYSEGTFYVIDITPDNCSDYLGTIRGYTAITRNDKLDSIKSFLIFYDAFLTPFLNADHMAVLNKREVSAEIAQMNANRYPNIPEQYFNQLISSCIKILNDEEESDELRATAAMVIILSQTGMRIGELLSLQVDKLQIYTAPDGQEGHLLKYQSWKSSKGDNGWIWSVCYLSEIAQTAYNFLSAHYENERKVKNTNLLYIANSKVLPVNQTVFRKREIALARALDKYFPTFNLDENYYYGVPNLQVKNWKEEIIGTVAFPHNHSFRTHVCTEYYRKGVPIPFIRRYMNHISDEVVSHYIYTEDKTKKKAQQSRDILKGMITGELKPLGNDHGLMERLRDFIEKNKLSVAKDIDEICDRYSNMVPITPKTGGVCIKSSPYHDCGIDSPSNEFYCAYGVCPNLYHFYYMADVSLRKSNELAEAIVKNEQNGFDRAKEKCINMRRTIIKTKLLPELEELKSVLEKRGEQYVLDRYPNLADIVQNLETIMEDSKEWLERNA